MDKIGTLPDEILGHILSFLSTQQAGSTSVLSKRWRNVFLLVPSLNLRYVPMTGQYLTYPTNFMDFVESLLRLQGNSLIKKFTLQINRSGLNPTRVQNWICNVLERGLEDLKLFISYKGKQLQVLPLSIFKSNTLVKLSLGGRGFKMNLPLDVYLPKLRTLCLDNVDFDGVLDFFEILLPRCPVLEELVVDGFRSSFHLCGSLYSPSLKRLCFRFTNIPIISLDLPNLVYLELGCYFRSKYANVNLGSLVEARIKLWVDDKRIEDLRAGSAPLIPTDMIHFIIGIRNVRVLHLSSNALEMLYFSGQELPMFDNLVSLSISSHRKRGWQILPLLIKNSPNLETLIFVGLRHLITTNCGDVCVCSGSRKKNNSSCLSSSRVKVLDIWCYRGTEKQLKQMKHFLNKLPCLEMVKIRGVHKHIEYLSTLPKASPNCKIQAVKKSEKKIIEYFL